MYVVVIFLSQVNFFFCLNFISIHYSTQKQGKTNITWGKKINYNIYNIVHTINRKEKDKMEKENMDAYKYSDSILALWGTQFCFFLFLRILTSKLISKNQPNVV